MSPSAILSSKNARSCRRGFTLVEVLAATALLSIGLLAVIVTGGTAREYHQRSLWLSVGRAVAQNRIEQLRSMAFDSLPDQAGTTSDPALPRGNSIVTTVSSYPTTDVTDLYRVVVRVTWPEGNGIRTITYETLVARK